jgi:hypothetical protein
MLSNLGWSMLFSIPKAAQERSFYFSFETAPTSLTFRGTDGLLITTRCDERDLSIDEFDDLSNDQIIASASGKFAACNAGTRLSFSHQSRAHNGLRAVKYI